jgi:hypothetical protein
MTVDMSKHTLRYWLDIYKDLDSYIARGGKLLDLRSFDEEEFERFGSIIGDYLGEATCNRLARYSALLAERAPGDRILGEMLTEKEMRDAWHQTAGTIQ